jgi:hypothetical protein
MKNIPQLARIFTVLLFLLWFRFPAYGQQAEGIDWHLDAGIAVSDRTVIEKLVKGMGIAVARVSVVYVLPTGGQVLNVESRVVVEGKHRTWIELSVCRKDWRPFHCSTKSRNSVGRWQASPADLEQREAWRIQDGDWHLDVPVETGLPYADAEQIVLAIRRGQLVDRLPTSIGPLTLNAAMPEIDLTEITRINKTVSGYEVRTGRATGFVLRLRITGSAVELYSYSTWIV